MFNWHAAFACFSVVGTFISAVFAIATLETGREEIGIAFCIATMILVFVSGGLLF